MTASDESAGVPEQRATWTELFFDLVVVAGIGQLAHLLHDGPTWGELGLYAVAVNAGEVLLYLPNAVGSAIVPNLVKTGRDELEETSMRAFRMVFAVTTVAVIGAAVTGALLIPVVFGSKFEGSITPFLLLLPGAWGYAAQKVFSSSLTGLGQPGRTLIKQ